MKRPLKFGVKWSVMAFSLLLVGTQNVNAQPPAAPTNSTKPPMLKKILGEPSEGLLAGYGKPTAVYFLEGSDSSQLSVPDGVPTFSSKALPKWAQPVAFPLQGRAHSVVWLYKSNHSIISYLLDPLGYVEAACIVRQRTFPTPKVEQFHLSASSHAFLGLPGQAVLERYGKPIQIRSVAPGFVDWSYSSKATLDGHKEAFANTFTLHDNLVVRVTSFLDVSKASGPVPFDGSPQVRGGHFFLLNPS